MLSAVTSAFLLLLTLLATLHCRLCHSKSALTKPVEDAMLLYTTCLPRHLVWATLSSEYKLKTHPLSSATSSACFFVFYVDVRLLDMLDKLLVLCGKNPFKSSAVCKQNSNAVFNLVSAGGVSVSRVSRLLLEPTPCLLQFDPCGCMQSQISLRAMRL